MSHRRSPRAPRLEAVWEGAVPKEERHRTASRASLRPGSGRAEGRKEQSASLAPPFQQVATLTPFRMDLYDKAAPRA